MQPEILDILLRKTYVVYVDWGQASLRAVNLTWTDLYSLAFIINVFNHFCITSRLVCSLSEAMPGSLSVANIAVSSTDVVVLDSVGVGRSSVYCDVKAVVPKQGLKNFIR
jgi:hypothetical protein